MPPPYSLPCRQRCTSIEALANTLAARPARTAPRGHQIQPAAQRLERRVFLVDFPARAQVHTQCMVQTYPAYETRSRAHVPERRVSLVGSVPYGRGLRGQGGLFRGIKFGKLRHITFHESLASRV
jgi:hypothetical protein